MSGSLNTTQRAISATENKMMNFASIKDTRNENATTVFDSFVTKKS